MRRFTLGEAMILVAATAMALPLVRFPLEPGETAFDVLPRFFERSKAGWTVGAAMGEFTAWAIVPFLALWTVAVQALHLRWPRPSRRRLARQPGAMAVVLGTVVIGFVTAGGIAGALALGSVTPRAFINISAFAATTAGTMILGEWIAMAVGGRWRPEPTWLDRFGRVLGVSWIVAGLAGVSYFSSFLR